MRATNFPAVQSARWVLATETLVQFKRAGIRRLGAIKLSGKPFHMTELVCCAGDLREIDHVGSICAHQLFTELERTSERLFGLGQLACHALQQRAAAVGMGKIERMRALIWL